MPEAESPIGPAFDVSVVDVCNNALDLVLQEPIASLDDNTPKAKACKRYFPSILRAMIEDHNWRFARRRVYLPQLDSDTVLAILGGFGSGGFGGGGFGGGQTSITITAIPGPYPFWYAMPNNCVRPRRINGDARDLYGVYGRILMANTSPVFLDYGAYIDNPNVWNGKFQAAFELAMASRLAQRIAKDSKQSGQLYALYQSELNEAKATDSQFDTPEILISEALTWDRE